MQTGTIIVFGEEILKKIPHPIREATPDISISPNNLGMVVENRGSYTGICFGKDIRGHDCGGKCVYGFGYYIPTEVLESLEKIC